MVDQSDGGIPPPGTATRTPRDAVRREVPGVLFALVRDPYLFSFALWDDEPHRRVIRDRDFMDGFEITVGVEIDEENHTVVLQWIDRVFVEEPEIDIDEEDE